MPGALGSARPPRLEVLWTLSSSVHLRHNKAVGIGSVFTDPGLCQLLSLKRGSHAKTNIFSSCCRLHFSRESQKTSKPVREVTMVCILKCMILHLLCFLTHPRQNHTSFTLLRTFQRICPKSHDPKSTLLYLRGKSDINFPIGCTYFQ